MRTYKVNKIEHTVFDETEELPENIHFLKNWREGHIGDWVQADDGCIVQILREGTMLKANGKNKQVTYLGTCTGTFAVNKSTKMDTSRRMNIYSFGGSLSSEEVLEARKDLNSKERLFVLNLAKGMDPKVAYMKVYPTNNPGYANVKAAQLIKTERVNTAMKEDLKPICEELGIDPKAVLTGIKIMAQLLKKMLIS